MTRSRRGRPQPSLFDTSLTGEVAITPAELAVHLGEDFPPTPEQNGAIVGPLRPHVVVAGAGSGKTQTMGLRVVWLVANGLVEPHRVLGLTFTRKAAAELGERVRHMLSRLHHAHERAPFLPDQVAQALRTGEPTVTTYHSYAAALVGEHALRIGLEPDTRLIGEAMSWQLATQVVETYDGAMESVSRKLTTVIGDVLALAGELSEHLRTPADVVAVTDEVRAHLEALPRAPKQRTASHYKDVADLLRLLDSRVALLPMVEAYIEAKKARQVMDYGDQVAIAARIARDHPEVGELERARFGAVLLDEYQDTGEAQRVLLTSLYAGGHPVTAVGDPRQSIYGWRGASAGNLERFPDDFSGPTPETAAGASRLTVSFRNGERVLAAANLVADGIPVRAALAAPAAHGTGTQHLRPGPGRVGQGRVVVGLHSTVLDEAQWVADTIAALGRDPSPAGWGEIAVLARRRAAFPALEAALRARGVPCEVVGLGGLLHEPEVVDVVSTLRVLADPTAGAALLRLLAGPRWRVGPRDLDALGRRARSLAVGRGPVVVAPTPDAPRPPEPDDVDERSLVDAVEDPGDVGAYSAAGLTRIQALRDELRRLRRLSGSALPDLVMAVVRAIDLDVELTARPEVRAADAMLDVDRLVEVAEEFVSSGEDPGLVAFLAYLDTAEDRERGLEVEVGEPDGSRVQLMTIHAAKGLEWDVVVVAGLTETVFPQSGRPVADWTRQDAALPFPLRGDRSELPELAWQSMADQVDAHDLLGEFQSACRERAALEEQRLAYVAVTRPRDLLVCSGYWWDTSKKPRGPSALLLGLHELCLAGGGDVAVWVDPPADDAEHPLESAAASTLWPADPLGERRQRLTDAAALVRQAAIRGPGPQVSPGAEAAASPAADAAASPAADAAASPDADPQVAAWDIELELLLAELARQQERRAGAGDVLLPSRLSVSQLVVLRRDPAELARSLRRPVPRKPAPLARRGTRFHLWLEARWGQQRLIDVDELPGAADETAAPGDDLLALQAAFEASRWASRVPTEIELPFDMTVGGVLLRGRCDAVFTDDPGGMVDVVDWKTGPPARGAEAEAAAVQLAVYRLAWHRLHGTPLDQIRAAFHHVAAGVTVRPADLLDEAGLVELIRSVPGTVGVASA